MPYVYILRCADDTFYVGRTDDLAAREQTHNDGHGAKYTATRRPVRMVYAEEYASMRSAVARERQLKGWTSEEKDALVCGDRATLSRLSQQQTHARNRIAVTWRDLIESGPQKR
jgi:predicted GIY-YIG superfamily endonuclease